MIDICLRGKIGDDVSAFKSDIKTFLLNLLVAFIDSFLFISTLTVFKIHFMKDCSVVWINLKLSKPFCYIKKNVISF